ncbi:hypothetical protein EDB89DRAFT_1910788 [Lactarius sanguifluus]|nr:hypothetical protein EDB89DRAFT_1910788 [Lactarius sanguifluus]
MVDMIVKPTPCTQGHIAQWFRAPSIYLGGRDVNELYSHSYSTRTRWCEYSILAARRSVATPHRHRIRAVAGRVIAVSPSLSIAALSLSYELALLNLLSWLNRRCRVVVPSLGGPPSSCLGDIHWWGTVGVWVVVVVLNVERGKPPWPVGSNLFHARPVIASSMHANLRQIQATCTANDKLRQHALEHASSSPTQLRAAQTPAAAQHPANAATTTTRVTAMGRSDGGNAATTGQRPSITTTGQFPSTTTRTTGQYPSITTTGQCPSTYKGRAMANNKGRPRP